MWDGRVMHAVCAAGGGLALGRCCRSSGYRLWKRTPFFHTERACRMRVVHPNEPLNPLSSDGASAISGRSTDLWLRDETQTSILLSQEACTGKKRNRNVHCGWVSNQFATSADQWELTGSASRWMCWPLGVPDHNRQNSASFPPNTHPHEILAQRMWQAPWHQVLTELATREAGQDVVEYGLLIASIAVIVLIGIVTFGAQIEPWFAQLAGRITTTGT